ncbi:uncharacterized protein LOC114529979 isoform X2 [Dendronephthya gigantea]|uniref:uncharacterized protein LOC114529979 isoform X2 n=1 Tax=Dendronephthya gigantea TaxID=151771 RepID=UPI001069338D|nr:uncharacterized protein LOC114529979 isoform X2 [Dendronephthya gigantea]
MRLVTKNRLTKNRLTKKRRKKTKKSRKTTRMRKPKKTKLLMLLMTNQRSEVGNAATTGKEEFENCGAGSVAADVYADRDGASDQFAKELDVVQRFNVALCTEPENTNTSTQYIVDMDLASCGRPNESRTEFVSDYPSSVLDATAFATNVERSVKTYAATESVRRFIADKRIIITITIKITITITIKDNHDFII